MAWYHTCQTVGGAGIMVLTAHMLSSPQGRQQLLLLCYIFNILGASDCVYTIFKDVVCTQIVALQL